MTNYEKIKNMSVDEMAKWLEDKIPESCKFCASGNLHECGYWEKGFYDGVELCIKNRALWLESEVEE